MDDSSLSVAEVIGMFAELDLPVTDDGALIEQKYSDKKPVYLREMRSPNPKTHEHGAAGMRNGEAMCTERGELLEVIYQSFRSIAATARHGSAAAGARAVSQAWIDGLVEACVTTCKTDRPLAEAFTTRFLTEERLEKDKPLFQPAQVTGFHATPRSGAIALHWSYPSDSCDKVELYRRADQPAGGKRAPEAKLIYFGGDDGFIDGEARAGERYEYRVHAVYYGNPGADSVARAVCLGEVSAISVAWKAGGAQVSWSPPGDCSVLVFRKLGAAPAVIIVNGAPHPGDALTSLPYQGSAGAFIDSGVPEGMTVFYTILCDFGEGIFSAGDTKQFTAPKPPPNVPALSAAYSRDPSQHMVVLEWKPAPSDSPVEYVLVRREGSAPPARPTDGEQLCAAAETRFIDTQVQPGHRYTYAVFSRAGQLDSRQGAASQPVDILADVTALAVQASDGAIELTWETPPNAQSVIVRRGEQPLRGLTDGALVPQTGTGHARDEGLTNGVEYHYLVACVYRPVGTAEVVSAGSRVSAVPEKLPEPPLDFCARAQGLEVQLSWTTPRYGQVVLVRSARPLGLAFGQRLETSHIDRLGERLVAGEGGHATDPNPDLEKPFYTIFASAGRNAVAGGSAAAVVCADPSHLRIAASRDGVILRWTWPPGVKAVRVARRLDAPPAGVDDPQTGITPYSLIDYRAAGDKFVDKIEGRHGRFHYTVFSQVSSPAGQFYSPGASEGCRAVIQWEPWMTLTYSLAPGSGPHAGKDIQLKWTMLDAFPNFAGFVLIASQEGVPVSADDGVELMRWQPQPGQRDGQYDAWVSLAPVQMRRWGRFFCKLMALDTAQSHATLIVHPNTCLQFTPEGKPELPLTAAPLEGYRAGVPKTVICPYCFQEFPVEEMLYTSPMGGEPRRGKYNAADRLLKRLPQFPSDEQGRVMNVKLCPSPEHHVLPYTAGWQSNLIVGLIGAKFSGKSHFIATLIDRLENQVGSDMDASLMPVTDETRERYRREFYAPLFKNSLELSATIGRPPPLIYDLSLSGRQWDEKQNRSVTLSLYDTAGENLQDAQVARAMVQYLGEASGIIFLVDPLQVPAVRELLPAHVQPPELDHDAAPNQIIANVLQLLERGKVIEKNAPISIPVAVVLTKCDVLVEAGLIDSNRLWSTEKRHIGYFDRQAQEDMNGMMGELFQRWNRDAYNNIRQRFARHAFFGASATGCASDPLTRRYRFIAPWRVEDPLLWILSELNVIKQG